MSAQERADRGWFTGRRGGWLPGGGPWRILAECPGQGHNTLYSARGRDGKPRCICPRALAMAYEALARKRVGANPVPKTSSLVQLRSWPDLSGGACQTERGVQLFDSTRAPGREGNTARRAAKWACARCPVRELCASTLSMEVPAGGWGGIIAGMAPEDRRRAAKKARLSA